MHALPTGTVTFLFTDIEGSTKLLQQLGDEYASMLGEHQTLLRTAFAAHAGIEVDTQGDAFFVAFPTAPTAVAAAADATRALAAHAWPADAVLRVRIGLHTGTPQLVGGHYVGLDVHRAARIAAAGHGGQILLSQTTRDLAIQRLPAGTTLRALGPHRLKDLQEPEPLFQVVLADPGLPADFPPLKTLDTYRHNLPLQPTPLLGRSEQVAGLCALLRRPEVRLVTLTGPGGIGKTRLAVQVAAELVDSEDFADGVWFVRLSRLTDPRLVIPTIAQTLEFKEQGATPIAETLRAHLADRRLLLALDNFEQVVGAAPEVAGLLAAIPGLRVLVTSRLPLHLRGEREYALAPLPVPEVGTKGRRTSPDRLSQYAAVALFVERAQAARADFAVTAANAPAIAEICARLDGLPLAIELAAARVKVLPPEALLARLSAQLKLLTGGARDLEERQQTMRATLAWSEALLTPQERVLFRRLAVFAGGGTLEAAEAVCATPEGTAPLDIDVLDGLGVLVDQSLVQQRAEGGEGGGEGGGEPRFGMLHVIREYALEQLKASGESEGLSRTHATFYLALAEQAEPAMIGSEASAWYNRLEREHDNLRAALRWACDSEELETGLRLVAALRRFWEARGYFREGQAWVETMVTSMEASEDAIGPSNLKSRIGQLQARALVAGAALAVWQGEYTLAAGWLDRATTLGRAARDPGTTALALIYLGLIAEYRGEQERAVARYEESLELYREAGELAGISLALSNLGLIATLQGALERADELLTEALTLGRQVGDKQGIAGVLNGLKVVAKKRGEMAEAVALGREALALDWERGDLRLCAVDLEGLAGIAGEAGQGERAARLLGSAAALREVLGTPQPTLDRVDTEQDVAAARAALGEEAWAAAFAAGQALSLDEAIAQALAPA